MRLLIFVAILFAAPLAAQDRESEKAELFRKLDANGDGRLTAEELAAPAAREGNWIAADRNGDGRIDLSEFTIVRPPASAVGATRPPAEERPPAKAAARP